ncbi:hypothetical protein FNF28_03694 [Cafeteria roenbergensis]|uniref:Major facilitator superfamily (MFS) profile domain-containing protein n=1 Tax=Cafeteria roenbergensis TaxID=33653 RepID=A0A5A8DJI0_CAFRO|nr:hypothetical protein FNF28_03694 [Cafeteria roenbergensis]
MNKWATLAMLFAAYATYYVTKKNYPYILAALSSSTTQGMAEGELFEAHSVAAMGSVHEAMCAVSKVAGGVFVDALPAPAVLAGSLAITAAANAVVATTSSLSVMVVSWGVNGFFQAFGWAAVGSIFFEWFPDPSQRGALYSVLSTSQNAGAAVAAVIVPLAMEATGTLRAILAAYMRTVYEMCGGRWGSPPDFVAVLSGSGSVEPSSDEGKAWSEAKSLETMLKAAAVASRRLMKAWGSDGSPMDPRVHLAALGGDWEASAAFLHDAAADRQHAPSLKFASAFESLRLAVRRACCVPLGASAGDFPVISTKGGLWESVVSSVTKCVDVATTVPASASLR